MSSCKRVVIKATSQGVHRVHCCPANANVAWKNSIDKGLAVAQDRTLDESQRRDDVMRIIRFLTETAKESFETYSDEGEFDRWIERAGNQWAVQNGFDIARLQVICALATVP